MFNVTSSPHLKKKRPEAELWEMTEAVADALQRAELRLMERAELGVASESSMGALGSMAASMAEVGIGFRMGCGEFCGAPCFFFRGVRFWFRTFFAAFVFEDVLLKCIRWVISPFLISVVVWMFPKMVVSPNHPF